MFPQFFHSLINVNVKFSLMSVCLPVKKLKSCWYLNHRLHSWATGIIKSTSLNPRKCPKTGATTLKCNILTQHEQHRNGTVCQQRLPHLSHWNVIRVDWSDEAFDCDCMTLPYLFDSFYLFTSKTSFFTRRFYCPP